MPIVSHAPAASEANEKPQITKTKEASKPTRDVLAFRALPGMQNPTEVGTKLA